MKIKKNPQHLTDLNSSLLREIWGVMETFYILVTQLYSLSKLTKLFFNRVNFTIYIVYFTKPDQNQNQNILLCPHLQIKFYGVITVYVSFSEYRIPTSLFTYFPMLLHFPETDFKKGQSL